MMALARAGSLLFWNVRPDLPAAASGASPRLVWPTLILCLMGVVMSAYAAPLQRYTDATAAQLLDRAGYARAVLGVTGTSPAPTTRPYDGQRPPAAAPTEETR